MLSNQFPDYQESVSDVFVGPSFCIMHLLVHYVSDCINKKKNIFLKDLCSVSEVPDITETINSINLSCLWL